MSVAAGKHGMVPIIGCANRGMHKKISRRALQREALSGISETEKELPPRRKDAKTKGKVRAKMTMTLSWITQRLHMGSWTYVSNLLREKK